MADRERVGVSLNKALHALFDRDERLYLLGQDIADPYGGAFGISRGLSARYPLRVLSTPISESGIVGVASGLALAGDKVIVEIMFGDFAGLAFDQILNFASKSVGMYGRRQPMPLVIRCPVGGNRGYGPTHSQSLQKHFIGIPHLSLHEITPFHDVGQLLARLVDQGEPAIIFEPKLLYGEYGYRDGEIDDTFGYRMREGWAHAYPRDAGEPEVVLIAPGGVAHRALEAARGVGASVHVLVPERLHPLDLRPVADVLARARRVCVAEESTAGGTWGADVAYQVHATLWDRLAMPVLAVSSPDSVIPAARHLEREVLVQADTIAAALESMLGRPARALAPGRVSVPTLNANDATYVLLTWLAADGDLVDAGQPIAEIETSKAVQELVAAEPGVLRPIVAAGAQCEPGETIALLERSAGTSAVSTTPGPSAPGPSTTAPQAVPAAGHRGVALTRAQRAVAELVTASHRDIPAAFAVLSVRIDTVLRLLDASKDSPNGPIGLLDFLIMAVGRLRPRFPALFGTLAGDEVRPADEAHVGVTLDAGHGLFMPVIRSVEHRTAADIADQLADLRMRALRGTYAEADLRGANIAISWNFEPDVLVVQPIIPPGLACVVSIGGPRREIGLSGSAVSEHTVVSVGLAHDHRVVNGREAIEFLRALAAMADDERLITELIGA
jgi:pyruvate/2-oxoglutarate/acetoin dehydrogenase E1 component/pyruvate/2-oxoglutarate dehydrogenase complex dihydrolipoamide acyltransferase (E2) component